MAQPAISQPTPPKRLILPVDVVEAVANYLARQPWIEVHELIAALQKAEPEKPPNAD